MQLPLVLATVILDPPTALLIGSALALVSMRLVRLDPEREVMRTGLFGAGAGLFYGLCVGWFYFVQPDWMLVYLKDAQTVPLPPTYLGFLLVLIAHGAAGGWAGATLIARGKAPWAWALAGASALTLAGFFYLQWTQYFLIGTYAQYHAGTATPVEAHPAMPTAMNLSGAATALGLTFLVVLRFRLSKSPRR